MSWVMAFWVLRYDTSGHQGPMKILDRTMVNELLSLQVSGASAMLCNLHWVRVPKKLQQEALDQSETKQQCIIEGKERYALFSFLP